MKTIKRVSTDYDIYASTVTVNGNLVVVGSTTTVGSVNTFIADNIITLASGQGGLVNAGIEVDRGTDPSVGIRWNPSIGYWEYTNNGTLWKLLSITKVEEDLTPRLGGNLIVQNSSGVDYTITHDPGRAVTIGPVVRLPQIADSIEPAANYSTIYADAPEAGQTGFYVSNNKTKNSELITKRRAFIYSLIF